MRKSAKRTVVAALAGVMAVGMLAGCGEKKLDGTKTVATINGTEIPMGMLSLYARQQQAQTEAMYQQFMGSSASGLWEQVADEESGETYGEQAVKEALDQIEQMYIMKEKAADYGVEVTEDEQKAIEEAAAAFMEANDEATIEALAVTEDQVKTLLELETYREKIYEPIVAEAGIELTDEEVQQSAFTYVSVSTTGDDLTEEDITKKKEQAQEVLDKVKEDPTADMGETAKTVDETFSALTGTFTTNESEDEDLSSTSYPDEVITALRTLKEGEVYGELIETDSSVYIVRLDTENDEEATASKKESVTSSKESAFYTETTDKWLEDAEVKTDDKVLKTLTLTSNHIFTMKAEETTEETTEEATDESADEELEEVTDEETVTEDTTEDAAAEEGTEDIADVIDEDAVVEEAPAEETDSTEASDTSTDVVVEEEETTEEN